MSKMKKTPKVIFATILLAACNIISRLQYKVVNFVNIAHLAKMHHCGKRVILFGRMNITGHSNISFGDDVFVGENARLQGGGGLTIGNNVIMSRNVTIYTLNHDWKSGCLPYGPSYAAKKVEVGSNVWIGMNVSIRPGVTIGDGAIVGMNTVVLKDIPSLAIVNMHGAVVEKQRDSEAYANAVAEGNLLKYADIKNG
jgi:acetyltransferase-like isoleucine patch superfamily enzyme